MIDVYVHTSALAKWYLNEAFSESAEAFLREAAPVSISALTKVEMRSLLARRRREGSLPPLTEAKAYSVFEGDINAGHLILLPVRAEHYLMAESILGSLPDVPLRSLDALHLGIVQSEGIDVVATADRILAEAVARLGWASRTFF